MAANLDLLHPTLRRKVKAVLNDLKGHGYPAKAASGWRSLEEQAALYAHGRSKVRFSFHNARAKDDRPCALAADIVSALYGWGREGDPVVEAYMKTFWRLLASSRDAHGLHPTAAWDPAHLQLCPNSDLAKVRKGWSPPLT